MKAMQSKLVYFLFIALCDVGTCIDLTVLRIKNTDLDKKWYWGRNQPGCNLTPPEWLQSSRMWLDYKTICKTSSEFQLRPPLLLKVLCPLFSIAQVDLVCPRISCTEGIPVAILACIIILIVVTCLTVFKMQ